LTCDFALAVVLLWLFYVAAVDIAGGSYYDYYGRSETLEACEWRVFLFFQASFA
jgi:hypothetical protein